MRILNVYLISLFCLTASVSHSEIRTSLASDVLSFISPDYNDVNSKTFGFFGAHVKSVKTADHKADHPVEPDLFKIDLKGMYAAGNSVMSYLNIREIYYTYPTDEVSNIYMGRKLNDWSAIDSLWNMGVYQPQFTWNQINPQSQGLTGLFWVKNKGPFGLVLFATPIFIPDQGASFEIKDGQFQSGNPFFQSPPQNIKFQNQLLPIDYQLTKPETSDVVFQSQLGAQFRFGDSKGFFANLGAIYKPSNQIALGYKGVLVTTRVRVDVTAKTYLENVYSADLGYKDDWGSLQIGALYSKPQDPEFDSSFNKPQFAPSLSFGPQFLYRLNPFEFFAAYLDTSGGEITEVGPDASVDRKSLSERFLYKQAAILSVSYSDIYAKKLKVDSKLQFKFSSKEGFRQINFKNSLNLRGPLAFTLDMILIDTDSSIPTRMESYKNLDQVWLGVTYDI